MTSTKFGNAQVDRVFRDYPPDVRKRLLKLRGLIFDVAKKTDRVGPLTEVLKWGQPGYLTEETKSGSTVRLHTTKTPGEVGVFFICHTGLINRFRDVFPDVFRYDGTRAIIFGPEDRIDENALAQCLAMALTYKLKR